MIFSSPWMFTLLLLIPLTVWLEYVRHSRTGSIGFSTTRSAVKSGRSIRQRLTPLCPVLRTISLVLLVIALARPRRGTEQVRDISKGIAIEMALDRSSSMSAEMELRGKKINRFDAAKMVFESFVLGDKQDLKGRPNDLIGMITFARYPDTACPLTLAHGALPKLLENARIVQRESEDGTAIGDAIALAAARLKTAEETFASQTMDKDGKKDYEIKSKVIILLTDGASNCGKRSPISAARLAAEWGIKIYAIGVGGNEPVMSIQTFFGVQKFPTGQGVDETTLKAIAKITGGLYRRADTPEALKAVYEEIDTLEKSEIESIRYVDYKEQFVPFALWALVLLCIEVLLRCTVFRRIP